MPTAQLPDRTLIDIGGPDAEHFLQNIITTDLDRLAAAEIKPGALLTPQGKILFDFLVSRSGETGLLLDCRSDVADDLLRRLTLYRLRARVDISKRDQALVLARWQTDSAPSSIDSTEKDAGWLSDTRFPAGAGVLRRYDGERETDAGPDDFARRRIAHGIAESGDDFALGDAFPHDVLLDETDGVGFRKGCYVGQEVVSRMQHRGTARRRVMLVRAERDLPASGSELRANDRVIGTMGGVAGPDGLAVMRIDRVRDALDAGHAISADGVPVTLSIPPWAAYTLPRDDDGAKEA